MFWQKNLQDLCQQFYFQPLNETNGFGLRLIENSDYYNYYSLLSNLKVVKYLPDTDKVNSLQEAQDHINFIIEGLHNNICIFLAIYNIFTNQLIGTVGLNKFDQSQKSSFIVYDLSPSFWDKGIMSNVINFIIDFAFNCLSLKTLKAYTMLENIASQRVLEKSNFKNKGLFPFYKPVRNKMVQVYLYELEK